jgi:hypothetical protein
MSRTRYNFYTQTKMNHLIKRQKIIKSLKHSMSLNAIQNIVRLSSCISTDNSRIIVKEWPFARVKRHRSMIV